MNEQELLNAAADGSWKEIEFYFSDGYFAPVRNLDSFIRLLEFNRNSPDRWRRKPQPKTVPLGPEDVLVTTQFRHKSWHDEKERVNVSIIKSLGIMMSHSNTIYPWKDLVNNWLRTDDSGKTWLPCSKEKADE